MAAWPRPTTRQLLSQAEQETRGPHATTQQPGVRRRKWRDSRRAVKCLLLVTCYTISRIPCIANETPGGKLQLQLSLCRKDLLRLFVHWTSSHTFILMVNDTFCGQAFQFWIETTLVSTKSRSSGYPGARSSIRERGDVLPHEGGPESAAARHGGQARGVEVHQDGDHQVVQAAPRHQARHQVSLHGFEFEIALVSSN